MAAQHLDRLAGLVTVTVRDRADVERFERGVREAVDACRERLERARARLAEVEARATTAESLALRLGATVLAAHEQLDAERAEAERVARVTLDAAAAAADRILQTARSEATALRAVAGELRLTAGPSAEVVDLTQRRDEPTGSGIGWDDERVAAG